MTKARCPMSLHGVISRGYEELGGVGEVAVVLPNRSTGWLYASTNPDLERRQQALPTYEDIRALTRAGALAFAEDLAGIAGYTLVPLGLNGSGIIELLSRGAAVMTEAGEAASTVAQACADGKITPQERSEMLGQMVDVQRAVAEAIKSLADTG